MGKAKYFYNFKSIIQGNLGRTDADTEAKIVAAFNDAQDIIALTTEMECLKSTLTVPMEIGVSEYEFDAWDISDLKHIYTVKIQDTTRYYDPLVYVTQQVWDSELAPAIHNMSGRPSVFTIFDDIFYFAAVPDDVYDCEIRFSFWPSKVTDDMSLVDVSGFDSSLISLTTAFTWLKLEEVELYQEWYKKASLENKLFRLDAMKVVDFIGKSRSGQVSVGPSYWADPFRRSTP